MRTELTDSAGRTFPAQVLKVDPETQLADLQVTVEEDGLVPQRYVARRISYSDRREPMTWRRAA